MASSSGGAPLYKDLQEEIIEEFQPNLKALSSYE